MNLLKLHQINLTEIKIVNKLSSSNIAKKITSSNYFSDDYFIITLNSPSNLQIFMIYNLTVMKLPSAIIISSPIMKVDNHL